MNVAEAWGFTVSAITDVFTTPHLLMIFLIALIVGWFIGWAMRG